MNSLEISFPNVHKLDKVAGVFKGGFMDCCLATFFRKFLTLAFFNIAFVHIGIRFFLIVI